MNPSIARQDWVIGNVENFLLARAIGEKAVSREKKGHGKSKTLRQRRRVSLLPRSKYHRFKPFFPIVSEKAAESSD